jgi:hypothetical protein
MTKEEIMGSFSKIKHKTYDTSNGFGNTEEWKKSFQETIGNKEKKPKSKFPTLAECETIEKLSAEYKKLLKKHHTDISGDTEENKAITQEIIAEYENLKNKFKSKK